MAYTPEFDLRDDQFRNYIINGDMRIAQRGKTFSSATSGQYSVDRWVYIKTGSAVHNLAQDTSDFPSFAQSGYLFQSSLHVNLSTPSTSIGSSDYYAVGQRIEGYNFANLAQKPFTISFWVKATTPGTYSVAIRNAGTGPWPASDRSIIKEFTINASSTWEKKTIQVPASPSAGTWDYATGIGLEILFVVAAGSSYQTTVDAWQTGNYMRAANQINGVNTGSTSFKITGVSVNEGYESLPFKTAGVNFTHELNLCQRYYWKTYDTATAPGTVTTNGAIGTIDFSVPAAGANTWYIPLSFGRPLRVAPGSADLVFYNPATGLAGIRNASGGTNVTGTFAVSGSTGQTGISNFSISSASAAITLGQACMFHLTVNAEL